MHTVNMHCIEMCTVNVHSIEISQLMCTVNVHCIEMYTVNVHCIEISQLMCILTSIIRADSPILVELIDLVNSVIIFLSLTTLLRWFTFLLGFQNMILTVLLFWIYFSLLMLVIVLQ